MMIEIGLMIFLIWFTVKHIRAMENYIQVIEDHKESMRNNK